jgi:hypothetical protein
LQRWPRPESLTDTGAGEGADSLPSADRFFYRAFAAVAAIAGNFAQSIGCMRPAGPYVWLLDIIGGRARFHRRILLELDDRRTVLLLRLSASMLTFDDRCSISSTLTHAL